MSIADRATHAEMMDAIQEEIDAKVAQAILPLQQSIDVIRQDAQNTNPHNIKVAFDQNYILLQATTQTPTPVPPRGSILMVDAGTTPNRVIALYLSSGDKVVEIFAKVI